MTKSIKFYYDFSSPYTYIAHKKIREFQKKSSIKFIYCPMLLGGLHKLAGITANAFIKNKLINSDIADHIKLINNLSGIQLSIANDSEFNDHDYIELIDDRFILYLQIKNMINVNDELNKIEKKITQFKSVLNKIDSKLNNKSFLERAPGEIINQNISNRKKVENDILSLESLKNTLSN